MRNTHHKTFYMPCCRLGHNVLFLQHISGLFQPSHDLMLLLEAYNALGFFLSLAFICHEIQHVMEDARMCKNINCNSVQCHYRLPWYTSSFSFCWNCERPPCVWWRNLSAMLLPFAYTEYILLLYLFIPTQTKNVSICFYLCLDISSLKWVSFLDFLAFKLQFQKWEIEVGSMASCQSEVRFCLVWCWSIMSSRDTVHITAHGPIQSQEFSTCRVKTWLSDNK